MTDGRLSNTEIFFLATAAMTAVLLSGGMLFETVAAAEAGSRLARVAPIRPVRAIYAWFVLLPTALAFLGIGVPFGLATIKRIFRREIKRIELFALAGLLLAFAAIWIPAAPAWSAPAGLAAMIVFALIGAGREGRGLLEGHAGGLLAAAGAVLVALAAWQYRGADSGAAGTIVGPSLVAAAGALLPAATATGLLAGLIDGRRVLWAAGIVLAALAWYGLPQIGWLWSGRETAVWIESGATAAAGFWLLLAGLRA